jgi:RNA polymerase sigma factor (sigma-70 family)
MPPTPEEWGRVLDRLLAGDRLAFMRVNRLVTGFLTQWRAYDFRDEWDDLRQEVLLAIIASARAGQLRDPAAFLAFVRSIARHKFADRLERSGRTHEKTTVPVDEVTRHELLTTVAPGNGPADDIWHAVRDLSPQHQQVLHGVYRHGKTYEQVAGDTGIPLGTVKRRLREGLDALRRRFATTPEPKSAQQRTSVKGAPPSSGRAPRS